MTRGIIGCPSCRIERGPVSGEHIICTGQTMCTMRALGLFSWQPSDPEPVTAGPAEVDHPGGKQRLLTAFSSANHRDAGLIRMALEHAARELDCGCKDEIKAVMTDPRSSKVDRWRACQHAANCGAEQAGFIRSIDPASVIAEYEKEAP